MSDAYMPPEPDSLDAVRRRRQREHAAELRKKLNEQTTQTEEPAVNSYHDVFVTTHDIERTSIFNLPYGLELSCTRVTGWRLIQSLGRKPPGVTDYVLLGGEYEGDDKWLVIDVAGHVILDSRPAVLSPEETQQP